MVELYFEGGVSHEIPASADGNGVLYHLRAQDLVKAGIEADGGFGQVEDLAIGRHDHEA
jgi:hypothetical protein